MNKKLSSAAARLGAKGGAAGKGTAVRKEVARKAALARWEAYRKKSKK